MNTNKKSTNKARLQLIISMSIFGTLAVFVRNISVSSGELALYRAILAAMLIGSYLLFFKNKSNFSIDIDATTSDSNQNTVKMNVGTVSCDEKSSSNSQKLFFGICTKKELLLLLFSGMAMGFNWILLFEAYKYTSVSAATLSYYFAPIIVTIVCPFLFHEKLTKKQILCFAMSTLGVFLITVGHKSLVGF